MFQENIMMEIQTANNTRNDKDYNCCQWKKSRMIHTTLLSIIIFIVFVIDHSEGFSFLLFAGGFGANNNLSKGNNKKKSKPSKKGSLREISTISEIQQQQSLSNNNSNDNQPPKLDKWGLPVPTLEDLFPPMPPGTELIPASQNNVYSLDDITASLKDHIDLRLDRCFDQNCIKKSSLDNDNNNPMKVNLLHQSPPVISIDNFFTPEECNSLKDVTRTRLAHKVQSATFQGALSTRTSTSWFCNFVDVPILLAKANAILNIPLECMEEPQIVRYQKGQEFSWHYDEVPAPQLQNNKSNNGGKGGGGQRVATLLVYLNDISPNCGGGTTFRDLTMTMTTGTTTTTTVPLTMQPKCGSALLFFPAFRDGRPDDRTLHKSEIMTCDDEKWIVQMWVHEKRYQAVLPAGNSNEAARSVMEEAQKALHLP